MMVDIGYDFDFLERKNRLSGSALELTPEIASTLGAILGSYLGGEEAVVITGRDYRKDTRMISRAFNAGLISVGTTVFELHSCSLPVLQITLRRFSAHAAVHFAAAHRSPTKINIRIFDQTGIEFPYKEIYHFDKMKKLEIKRAPPEKIADIISVNQATDIYQAAIKSALNLEVIRDKNFSVVVDCSLGPVAEVMPNILASIGCKVLTLNAFRPEGIPESLPSPTSLSILSRAVLAAKADLGICFDPSGSRVIFVDESGYLIDSHSIVAVLLQSKMVGREGGHIVLSETLWLLEDWLKRNKFQVLFASDAPGQLSRSAQFSRALFGANEQGNYIHPTFSNESEPFVTTLLLLKALAQHTETNHISSIFNENEIVNQIYLTEHTYTLHSNPEEFFRKLYEADNENKVINTLKGLKILYGPRQWVHIYSFVIPSKLTIKVCSESQEDRRKMLEETKNLIESLDQQGN